MRPSGRPMLMSIQQVERAIVFACLLSCCSLALLLRKRSELCCRLALSAAETSASWGCFIFAGSPLATPRRETFLSDLKSESNRSGAQDSRQRSRFSSEPCS